VDFAQIENNFGHTFGNRALLGRALTHRSWAHEQVAPGAESHVRALHNEALEFVGDSVLGLIVADYLFRSYPEVTEGELSRMKHSLVSAATLAKVSERLELGRFLRIGRGEEKTGGRRKSALLADAFEAVLAAVFLDGGLPAATDFLLRALGPELAATTPDVAANEDFKTKLQEVLQAARQTAPRYEVVTTEGPPHRRTFHVAAVWPGGRAQASGQTIKAAEMNAARLALEILATEK
jgi:ribonuclease-3